MREGRIRGGGAVAWAFAVAVATIAVSLAAAAGSGGGALGWLAPAAQAASTGSVAPPDEAAETRVAHRGTAAARRGAISRKRLRRKLRRLIDRAGSGSGAWVGMAEGAPRELFARRAGRSRILASNMKLFTTAAALDRLRAGGRLRTIVVSGGRLEQGTLRGNLILVGDGDPALGSRSFARRNGIPGTPFRRLARQIERAGIERVKRDVLADDTIFDRVRGVPASGGQTSRYIGPLSGLSYDSNRAGSGFVAEPALNTARQLREALRKRGVRVDGDVGLREAPRELVKAPPLAAVRSAPIRELAGATNRPSNNFFAEMLLKRLDAADGKPGTTRGGADAVERFARRIGSDVNAADGSGLTRSNTSTPKQVGKLLVGMRDHRAARAFMRSLAKAGKQGTVAGRMRGTAAEGRCRAKTGTLSGVSALSGYCRAPGGKVAFSILMNGVDVNRARQLQDKMAAVIARSRG